MRNNINVAMLAKMNWLTLHGGAGILYLLLCIIQASKFAINNSCNDLPLTALNVMVSILFALGLLTRRFQIRANVLGSRKFVFYRAALWVVAFTAQSLSIYSVPSHELFPPQGFTRQLGTVVSLLATFGAMGISQHEIRNRTIFALGWPVANILSYFMLLTMPILHALVGTTAIADYYVRHNGVGETVFIISLWSGFVTAWDTFFIGLYTAKRIQFDALKVIGLFDWIGLYTISLSCFLIRLHGSMKVFLTWYIFVGLLHGLSVQTDKFLVKRGIANFK